MKLRNKSLILLVVTTFIAAASTLSAEADCAKERVENAPPTLKILKTLCVDDTVPIDDDDTPQEKDIGYSWRSDRLKFKELPREVQNIVQLTSGKRYNSAVFDISIYVARDAAKKSRSIKEYHYYLNDNRHVEKGFSAPSWNFKRQSHSLKLDRVRLSTPIVKRPSLTSTFYCGAIQAKVPLPVVLEIDSVGPKYRYFYRKHNTIIPPRQVSKKGDSLTLAERFSEGSATLTLTLKGDGESEELLGAWKDGSKQLKVKLTEIPFRAGATLEEIAKGKSKKTFQVGKTVVSLQPRAVNGFWYDLRVDQYQDAAQIGAINKLLKEADFVADDGPVDFCGDFYFEQYDNEMKQVDLLSENLLLANTDRWDSSLESRTGSTYMEGEDVYFDLKNRLRLTPYENTFTDMKRDGKAIRRIVFEKMMQEAKRAGKSEEEDERCLKDYVPENIDNRSLKMTIDKDRKKLGLALSFTSYVDRACGGEFQFADTKKIEKYLNKNTELYRFLVSK